MQFYPLTNHALVKNSISRQTRDAGDFSDAAGEREMVSKCGSLPWDAGDLVGLYIMLNYFGFKFLSACKVTEVPRHLSI